MTWTHSGWRSIERWITSVMLRWANGWWWTAPQNAPVAASARFIVLKGRDHKPVHAPLHDCSYKSGRFHSARHTTYIAFPTLTKHQRQPRICEKEGEQKIQTLCRRWFGSPCGAPASASPPPALRTAPVPARNPLRGRCDIARSAPCRRMHHAAPSKTALAGRAHPVGARASGGLRVVRGRASHTILAHAAPAPYSSPPRSLPATHAPSVALCGAALCQPLAEAMSLAFDEYGRPFIVIKEVRHRRTPAARLPTQWPHAASRAMCGAARAYVRARPWLLGQPPSFPPLLLFAPRPRHSRSPAPLGHLLQRAPPPISQHPPAPSPTPMRTPHR